jgi:hypothetical protein
MVSELMILFTTSHIITSGLIHYNPVVSYTISQWSYSLQSVILYITSQFSYTLQISGLIHYKLVILNTTSQ